MNAQRRIMIVEDEAIVALDIQSRLRAMGFEIPLVVQSGEEAVEQAGVLRPDLILMDIMLEGQLDGIEAATRIRARHNIPIVFLTAYADEETLQRAKLTEAFGYIIKPFEDRELTVNIEMALYKHEIEKRILEKDRLLETTLNSIGDGVVSTDAEGRIKFLNPVARAILEQNGEEAMGRGLDDVFQLFDEEKGLPVAGLSGTALAGAGARAESSRRLALRTREAPLPVSYTIAPISDDDGDILGTVLVFRDVTELRNAEDALRESVERLKVTMAETVNALAVTSEKRDPYTAGHQQRVAQLACAIAERLGITGERLEGMRVAALLHDIGKIYVPAEILAKPATLTAMEMGLMKTHPEVGYDILKRVPFPWPVARIVLEHHERMDGSGYPNGLADEDILLESRILSVADVVEAMSSHRPYRAALGIERALDEVSRNRDRLYYPQAVDACLTLFAEGFTFQSVG